MRETGKTTSIRLTVRVTTTEERRARAQLQHGAVPKLMIADTTKRNMLEYDPVFPLQVGRVLKLSTQPLSLRVHVVDN
eukprot:3742763-Pyramimonas_sp.AAC.1